MTEIAKHLFALNLILLPWLYGHAQEAPPDRSNLIETALEEFEFQSEYFATPVTIPDDPKQLKITSIKLNVGEKPRDGVRAHIVFSTDELTFNEFGDAKLLQQGRSVDQHVKLKAVAVEDKRESHRQLFKLVFPDGSWGNRIYFVWSPRLANSSRLLIRADQGVPVPVTDLQQRPMNELSLLHMIPLRDSTVPKAKLQETLQNRFTYRTYHFRHFREEIKNPEQYSQGDISLSGTLDGTCYLTHDWNRTTFRPFGDPGMSTLMAYGGSKFQMKELPVKDPLKQGRRVFELLFIELEMAQLFKRLNVQPGPQRFEYSLITSPTTAGTPRLIIHQKGKVRHVLPLYDPNWKRFQKILAQLEQTSAREQQAITAIRKVIGSRFDFSIEQDQIISISFSGDSAREETLKHLIDLPYLRRLHLSHCRSIAPEAYKVLQNLTMLESLSFYGTPIGDSVLTHIEPLAQLKYLRIYDELPQGTSLADVPHVTDMGVASLVNLGNLQNLRLYGQDITDASVKLLIQMKNLKDIHLQDTAVSFGGLVKLAKKFPDAKIDDNKLTRKYSVQLSENSLSIHGEFDEQDLQHLSSLKNLKTVRIFGMQLLTHKGLKYLSALENLEVVDLQHSRPITDEGLKHLGKLTDLKQLHLGGSQNITDEGLVHLLRLNKLESLKVFGPKVTQEGIGQLKDQLPDCKINNR